MLKPPLRLAIAWFVLVLSACSGGGSNDDNVGAAEKQPESTPPSSIITERSSPSPSVQPTLITSPRLPETPQAESPVPPVAETVLGSDLLLTEISANLTRNGFEGTSWFELYNPTAAPIQLSAYTLRGSWRMLLEYSPGHGVPHSADPIDFPLSNVVIPAGGHLVVAAKSKAYFSDSAQVVHVGMKERYPDWDTDGSIELLRNGAAVDFARFGASTAMPATQGQWLGNSVNYWPVKDLFNTVSGSYVRMAETNPRDTNRQDDWTFVHYATPGGRHDMKPSEVDADLDGIPDSAEVQGGTYAGVDLFAMGARTGRRDIFVELDYMVESTPSGTISSQPQEEALQKVVDAFARKNVAVHFDVGTAYSTMFNPRKFNLGGGNPLPYTPCLLLERYPERINRPDCKNYFEYKTRYQDVRRRYIFHYGIFSAKMYEDFILAQAELFGNGMLFGLGEWSDGSNIPAASFNRKINTQASAIMHELGHNLGLHHGGNEATEYKPNYYSVMNPLYALLGLSASPQSFSASDRYRFSEGRLNIDICRFDSSPCSTDFHIDYSDGTGHEIDVSLVSESQNIGRGSVAGAYADWDGNGRLTTTPYPYHFNGSLLKPYPLEARILKDHKDWENLVSVGGVEGRKIDWDISRQGYSQATAIFSILD